MREAFRLHVRGLEVLRVGLLEQAGVRRAGEVVVLGGPDGLGETVRRMTSGNVVYVGPRELASGIPAADGVVDLVACELTFMWVEDQRGLVGEIHRVLVPGGCAVIAAEPDFGGVVDHPPAAGAHGLIAGLLRKNGADPEVGRRLRDLFRPDAWDTALTMHGIDPAPGPAGEGLESHVRAVREMIAEAVQASVLDRWERELRDASAAGTLLVHLPCFAMVARKLPSRILTCPVPEI
jgi:SAM-dependent methyltransferase